MFGSWLGAAGAVARGVARAVRAVRRRVAPRRCQPGVCARVPAAVPVGAASRLELEAPARVPARVPAAGARLEGAGRPGDARAGGAGPGCRPGAGRPRVTLEGRPAGDRVTLELEGPGTGVRVSVLEAPGGSSPIGHFVPTLVPGWGIGLYQPL